MQIEHHLLIKNPYYAIILKIEKVFEKGETYSTGAASDVRQTGPSAPMMETSLKHAAQRSC